LDGIAGDGPGGSRIDFDQARRKCARERLLPGRQPDRLAAQLGEMEAGQEMSELITLEHDPLLREQAIRAGGVVVSSVVAVRQVRPGQKSCTIDVESDQAVIRFRLDDKVRVVGTKVQGVVRALGATPNGGTLVTLEIQVGVRTRAVLTAGAGVELIRSAFGFVNYRALGEVRAHRPWIFYGDEAYQLAASDFLPVSHLATRS
jgi:hypothetical protein